MGTAGSTPMTVGSLVARATSNPGKLAQELGAWVLVGPPPATEENEWSFRTLSARTVRDAKGEIEAVLDDTYLVFALRKAQAGPWASTILVGRSRTNDVCVSHSSVSKLHARIRSAEGKLFLSDAGSSNGTSINGEKLAPDVERALAHATLVRFGSCNFQVFEPTKFAALLQKFARAPG